MKYKGWNYLTNKIDVHEGNDWLGMLGAGVIGLVIAIILAESFFGAQLHYWIANWF